MQDEKLKRKNDEPKRSFKTSCLMYLLLLLIILVAVIVILAMLGPTIGNIFSNIPCGCLYTTY